MAVAGSCATNALYSRTGESSGMRSDPLSSCEHTNRSRAREHARLTVSHRARRTRPRTEHRRGVGRVGAPAWRGTVWMLIPCMRAQGGARADSEGTPDEADLC